MGIPRNKLDKRLEELGCEMELDTAVLHVYPPEGKVFAATGGSVLSYQFSNGPQSWKPDAYEEVYEDLELGLRPE